MKIRNLQSLLVCPTEFLVDGLTGISDSELVFGFHSSHVVIVTPTTRKVTKFTNKPVKTNRVGLSWTDRKNKSSRTVKKKFRNTNSRLIMTEEVLKNRMKRSNRRKNFIVFKKQNDVDKIVNFFMNSY